MKTNNKTIVRSGEYKAPECDIVTLEMGGRILDLSNNLPALTETTEDW